MKAHMRFVTKANIQNQFVQKYEFKKSTSWEGQYNIQAGQSRYDTRCKCIVFYGQMSRVAVSVGLHASQKCGLLLRTGRDCESDAKDTYDGVLCRSNVSTNK